MIHYLKGDATNPQAKGTKLITHIVNTEGRQGRGFVMAVSRRWPDCRKKYMEWYRARNKNDFGLGAVQFVQAEKHIWVANLVGQWGIRTGSKGPPIRYGAIERGLTLVAEKALELDASVHMPRIGCGLAGGSWAKIEPIITQTLAKREVYVYDFD